MALHVLVLISRKGYLTPLLPAFTYAYFFFSLLISYYKFIQFSHLFQKKKQKKG